MKIIRFVDPQNRVQFGSLNADGSVVRIEGSVPGDFTVTTERATVAKLLAPIVPTQIIGIGLNYRKHAEESNAKVPELPVVFVKGVNTLANPEDPILIPTRMASDEVDYECELAVVIGKTCKNVSRADALKHVLGYTCANDVSARDWQLRKGGGQWSRGKFFDTFCPLGPCITTTDEIPDPQTLRISTTLNGQVMQDWTTSDMIFDVATIVSFLSGSTTIPAGTVILTGTPHGVGMGQKPPKWLKAGDDVTIEIERIGKLRNPVANEA